MAKGGRERAANSLCFHPKFISVFTYLANKIPTLKCYCRAWQRAGCLHSQVLCLLPSPKGREQINAGDAANPSGLAGMCGLTGLQPGPGTAAWLLEKGQHGATWPPGPQTRFGALEEQKEGPLVQPRFPWCFSCSMLTPPRGNPARFKGLLRQKCVSRTQANGVL